MEQLRRHGLTAGDDVANAFSQVLARLTFVDAYELEGDAKPLGKEIGQLNIEPHHLTRSVDEDVRQTVAAEPNAQGASFTNSL